MHLPQQSLNKLQKDHAAPHITTSQNKSQNLKATESITQQCKIYSKCIQSKMSRREKTWICDPKREKSINRKTTSGMKEKNFKSAIINMLRT